jgi:hypothetical protein
MTKALARIAVQADLTFVVVKTLCGIVELIDVISYK